MSAAPMGLEDANAEARRRWGPRGIARIYRNGAFISSRTSGDHRVGIADTRMTVYGRGSSFEAAFEDADRLRGSSK